MQGKSPWSAAADAHLPVNKLEGPKLSWEGPGEASSDGKKCSLILPKLIFPV